MFDGENEVQYLVAILDGYHTAVVLSKFQLDCLGADDLQAVVEVLGVVGSTHVLNGKGYCDVFSSRTVLARG